MLHIAVQKERASRRPAARLLMHSAGNLAGKHALFALITTACMDHFTNTQANSSSTAVPVHNKTASAAADGK